MTYPEPAVANTIMDRFIPIQVNALEEAGYPIVERYRQVWTPSLHILGSDGFEYYQWNGYLPPFEFLPQLLVGQGRAVLRQHDESGAAAIFAEVVRRFPTSAVAPEAQYFAAISAYRTSHDGNDLLRGWRRLQLQYPNSIWRVKQSFAEEKQQ